MTPAAAVDVEVGLPVAGRADVNAVVSAVAAAVESALGPMLAELGVAGRGAVSVVADPASGGRARVTAGGRRCWYPQDVGRSVAEALAGRAVPLAEVWEWPPDRLAAWAVEVAQVALRSNADVLVDGAVAPAGEAAIELRVERSYLRRLMASPGVQGTGDPGRLAFSSLRADLADMVGFDVTLELVGDDALPPATMRTTAGASWAPLRRLPPLDTVAAAVDPSSVPPGIEVLGELAPPWSLRSMSLLASWDESAAAATGVLAMTPPTYLVVLALYDGRSLAPTLVTTELVDGLRATATYTTERLGTLVSERVDLDRLTAALRALASEGIGLAPLEPLLQAALDADGEDLAAFLRSRVPFRVQRTVCGGATLLVPLVAGPDVVALLERPAEDETIEMLCDAIVRDTAEIGLDRPCVITPPASRAALRTLLERALPQCDIVADGELPARVDVVKYRELALP